MRIYVEAKKCLNYQTYTVGLDITLADGLSDEQRSAEIAKAQKTCRDACEEQIRMDQKR